MNDFKVKRRRGNPGTPPEIIDAIRFLREKYPEVSSKVILDKLGVRFTGKKYSLPTDRTVRNILARAGSPKKETIDRTWSLGASAKYNIPSEASSDLLKIWKWCILVGREFTIREAKWVARLKNIVKSENLLFVAGMYALQERMCKDVNDFNSSALDAWLVFFDRTEMWVYQSLQTSGIIPGIFSREKAEEFYGNVWLDWIGEPGKSVEGILRITPKHIQELSKEADMIYALWLRLLSQGPGWNILSDQEKNNLAQSLRIDIFLKNNIIRRALTSDKSFLQLSANEREQVMAPSKEILNKAGIDIEPGQKGINRIQKGEPEKESKNSSGQQPLFK